MNIDMRKSTIITIIKCRFLHFSPPVLSYVALCLVSVFLEERCFTSLFSASAPYGLNGNESFLTCLKYVLCVTHCWIIQAALCCSCCQNKRKWRKLNESDIHFANPACCFLSFFLHIVATDAFGETDLKLLKHNNSPFKFPHVNVHWNSLNMGFIQS